MTYVRMTHFWCGFVLSLQSVLTVRSLAVPRSVFSGFGRRVSSIFFGSQTTEVQELRRVVVNSDSDRNESIALVLTGSNLQKWKITQITEEVCMYVSM